MKILIIDNNHTFRQMLGETLKMNFSCTMMYLDGTRPDVLYQFNEYSPDILFMDVQSTEKCITYSQNFKALRPLACLIWLTSCDLPEYIQKARDGGIDYCLSKDSVTTDGIINLIRMVNRGGGVEP